MKQVNYTFAGICFGNQMNAPTAIAADSPESKKLDDNDFGNLAGIADKLKSYQSSVAFESFVAQLGPSVTDNPNIQFQVAVLPGRWSDYKTAKTRLHAGLSKWPSLTDPIWESGLVYIS
ncbi:MAG: hypothetical protein ACT4SY_03485 [Hyphomicrobiales bacterium]